MSTPATSTDPGGGRRPGAGDGRARGVPGARRARTPRERRTPLFGGERDPLDHPALLARCRREGRRAARRRLFDPWVLSAEGLLPRLASLAAERDRRRQALLRRAAERRGTAERAAAGARAEAQAAQDAARHTAAERAEREAHLTVTRAQLDRLAREAAGRRASREAVTRWLERRDTRGAPDGGGAADRDVPDADGDIGADIGGNRAPVPGGEPIPVRWEGESRGGLSRRGTLALLVCLTLVELPIYWTAFRRLHGTGDAASNLLTATFTLAVGAVMIAVPHILGRLLRALPATGANRLLAVPALALLATWAYACWVLGSLRGSLLAEERAPLVVDPDEAAFLPPELREPSSVLAQLNIGEQTMSLMFFALLLLSGGVAFLLGLGVSHPYLAAHGRTSDARRRLAAEERTAAATAHRAAARAGTLPAEESARRDALDAALREVDDLYEAAAHAYLDGLASAARDPAVTEAAIRLSGTWPLLPRPATAD
ncbi:hypothetical protein [Streptomyces profundus]|uniref:hypothetical protein n=1 Tax=Streptomyces profundus TaxID=2867410 RepID=UPI001D161306|nr:hypothetical protein [Streptomyces sp. MA3_2.13]UED87448.1 hypothetical protein K4G22_27355 [Streptomyces sp. MA3_2.13]